MRAGRDVKALMRAAGHAQPDAVLILAELNRIGWTVREIAGPIPIRPAPGTKLAEWELTHPITDVPRVTLWGALWNVCGAVLPSVRGGRRPGRFNRGHAARRAGGVERKRNRMS
jgi:hypothetical protein